MNVLILAAGMGSRLYPLTKTLPKSLLSAGGKTLLAHQLDALHSVGIQTADITLVGGHGYDHLTRHLPAGVKTVYNQRYRSWNNIYSITLGELGNGSTMLVNGDGLYDREIFALAVTHGEEDFLVMDSRRALADEQMKVRYEDDQLAEISKGVSPAEAAGEYVGIARFQAPTFSRIRQVAADMIALGQTDCWYESAIEHVARERPIGSLDIAGHPWIEVDDPDDLRKAAAMASRDGF